MAEKYNVFDESLKHKGFYNYSDLYNFCFRWLKEEGYLVSEDEYTEKLTAGGKDVKIKWVARKRISDYYRNVITLKWQIIAQNDVEVEENGKKIKTNKGDLKIKFEGDLEKDWEDNWDRTPFWKSMRSIYDKYIIRNTTEEYEDKLIDKTEAFVEEVKAFLNLQGRR